MARIIDGKAVAAEIKASVREKAEDFEKANGRKPGLAVVKAGNDPASAIYVRNKIKACEACNIASYSYYFDENVTYAQLAELIDALNSDGTVDGILVQLPLPRGIDERKVLSLIAPEKDADGFHAVNAGKLFLGERGTVACTPRGIMELIRSTGVSIAGKRAVVIGRSNIVGKPVAQLLLAADATVTVCHSKPFIRQNLGIAAYPTVGLICNPHLLQKLFQPCFPAFPAFPNKIRLLLSHITHDRPYQFFFVKRVNNAVYNLFPTTNFP